MDARILGCEDFGLHASFRARLLLRRRARVWNLIWRRAAAFGACDSCVQRAVLQLARQASERDSEASKRARKRGKQASEIARQASERDSGQRGREAEPRTAKNGCGVQGKRQRGAEACVLRFVSVRRVRLFRARPSSNSERGKGEADTTIARLGTCG